MSGDFYRAFEDRYRGSRDMIKERLRAYLPFVTPLAAAGEGAVALDLGCGRGEWLELLTEHAFAARGVDLDDGMLAACRERGLSVETADAIASLRALANDSVAVVSAFHLVEHLPFEVVQELVAQSLRVLQPGGLLIMETPNPENPMVGACRFYLDPSHQRPVPPNLLSFLTEHAGFVRQKVVPLQEDPRLRTEPVRLIDVLDGASPDYGVVAQKAAPAEVLERFELPFSQAFGLGIGELAQRFEDGQQAAVSAVAEPLQQQAAAVQARLAGIDAALPKLGDDLSRADLRLTEYDARLAAYEARLAQANLHAAELRAQWALKHAQHELQHNTLSGDLAELRTRVDSAQAQKERELAELHARIAEADARRVQKEQELIMMQGQLNAVFQSTSWRLTAPLRWVRALFRSRG